MRDNGRNGQPQRRKEHITDTVATVLLDIYPMIRFLCAKLCILWHCFLRMRLRTTNTQSCLAYRDTLAKRYMSYILTEEVTPTYFAAIIRYLD